MAANSLSSEQLQIEFAVSPNSCAIVLHDRLSSHRWPAVNAVAFAVYDRAQQRLNRITQFDVVQLQHLRDEIRLVTSDQNSGISLALSIRLVGGELSVKMSPTEVREDKPELYRLFTVEIFPGLMRTGASGEMLLPINTGVVCHPADKPACDDRFLIYGQQSRWELLPTLPACAVQTPAGGLTAIATAGAAETECHVVTDGRGSGTVALNFFMRGHDIDPVEQTDREIRFSAIPAGKDITVFTAAVLRKHITRDLKKPTLRQRAKESPEVAYLLGAYIMKLFYGMQVVKDPGKIGGDAPNTEFILTMTFDEARGALKAFSDAGVEKIYTQNVGWNLNGHDGAYPTRFPVEDRVGGERAFRDLIAFGHQLGYQMTVHDNYLDGYQISADFDPEVVARDPYGQLQIRGFWGGKPSFLLWPLAFSYLQLEAEMLRVKELGIKGPYYLDGMGSPLYINYHPKHRGTRTDLTRGIDRLLKSARQLYGSVATENGFLYCSLTPDLVANPGGDSLMKLARPEWPITALLDRCVPLWQLTMSGLVVTENQGISWNETMRALLYAQAPRFEWATRPGHHPVLDPAMIQKIKARYDLLIKRYGYLRLLQMTDYSRNGEIEATTFEDGTKVIADFRTGELRVNGERIERPACLID